MGNAIPKWAPQHLCHSYAVAHHRLVNARIHTCLSEYHNISSATAITHQALSRLDFPPSSSPNPFLYSLERERRRYSLFLSFSLSFFINHKRISKADWELLIQIKTCLSSSFSLNPKRSTHSHLSLHVTDEISTDLGS